MKLYVKLSIAILFMLNVRWAQAQDAGDYPSLNGVVSGAAENVEIEELPIEVQQSEFLPYTWTGIQTGASSFNAISEKLNWASACDKFASGSTYGEFGKFIVSELETNKYDDLIRGSSDLKKVCRGYDSLTRDGKQGLWVTILAAMANHESSCRPNPPLHRGPNGTLVGLLQLHLGKEDNYTDNCKKNSGRSAKASLKCSMSMISDQLQRDGRLFSTKSYWEVLRPNARKKIYRQIQMAISLYPQCR